MYVLDCVDYSLDIIIVQLFTIRMEMEDCSVTTKRRRLIRTIDGDDDFILLFYILYTFVLLFSICDIDTIIFSLSFIWSSAY